MENEKRFKSGDKVTYKSRRDCVGFNGGKGQYYYYDGIDQDGFVGEIRQYVYYIEDVGCWKIYVTTKGGGCYYMLESEFMEYDKPQVVSELFPIY